MEELLKKLKHGDEEAFESIVKSYEKQLYTIAKVRLKDESLAKDAIQETFLSLFLYSKRIKNVEKLKSWLIIVLINKCNDIVKENKIHNISFEENNFQNFIHSDDKITDKIDLINNINRLNNEERTILAMYYSSEYTLNEISKILNIKIGTIKSKISRAKSKLRKNGR